MERPAVTRRGDPQALPAELGELDAAPVSGLVPRPGVPGFSYDLDDRRDRARFYEDLLREGDVDQLRRFLNVEQFVELWEELDLPSPVRRAWAAWLREHRGIEVPLPAPVPSAAGEAVARAVAKDLAAVYGDRLRRVVLFGSFARGDADEESDVDLLVVLDNVEDGDRESDRLSDLAWEYMMRTGRYIQVVAATEDEFATSDKPFFANVRREGRPIL